jgi:hypothetical protein
MSLEFIVGVIIIGLVIDGFFYGAALSLCRKSSNFRNSREREEDDVNL